MSVRHWRPPFMARFPEVWRYLLASRHTVQCPPHSMHSVSRTSRYICHQQVADRTRLIDIAGTGGLAPQIPLIDRPRIRELDDYPSVRFFNAGTGTAIRALAWATIVPAFSASLWKLRSQSRNWQSAGSTSAVSALSMREHARARCRPICSAEEYRF